MFAMYFIISCFRPNLVKSWLKIGYYIFVSLLYCTVCYHFIYSHQNIITDWRPDKSPWCHWGGKQQEPELSEVAHYLHHLKHCHLHHYHYHFLHDHSYCCHHFNTSARLFATNTRLDTREHVHMGFIVQQGTVEYIEFKLYWQYFTEFEVHWFSI